MKLNLRVFLTVAFTLTATVPVIYLALWVERTAFETELEAVREKHLLLAKNITAALERYAADTRSTFNYLVSLGQTIGGPYPEDVRILARKFSIECLAFVTFSASGRTVQALLTPLDEGAAFPDAMFGLLGSAEENVTSFSPVMPDGTGEPKLFIYRRIDESRVAIAAIATTYFSRLQRAITFGRKGHAAIVDQAGRIIAHPNAQWEKEMRDISALDPVANMVAGRTGVTQFFSPAIERDMISGYTVVDGTGWGVMVPQPIDELEERAAGIFGFAIAIGLAGMASALLLGWLISGFLSQRLLGVVAATRKLRDGDTAARVGPQPRWVPGEINELSVAFDRMADRIESDREIMARALQDARQADLAKSEFLAHMSHELRTPLNAILGFSAMIRESMGSPQKMVEYGQDIYQSGAHLLAVINDILNISTIEAGRMAFQNQPTRLQELANAAVRLLGHQAETAGVNIDLQIDPDLPPLMVDPVKQRQVLVNLVSNALKFTPAGGTVTVAAARDEIGGVAISIRDTGIGMTEAEIGTALTPFGQVRSGRVLSKEGTGLGLPLSKSFVELQGGTFQVRSVPGEGTEIVIRFPAAKLQYDSA